MKKIIYALILLLVVVSGLVFANGEIKNETSNKPLPKRLSAAEREAAMKKWEATPDGIKYKEWEASPQGKKVYAGVAKIRKHIKDYTNMEGVVTSLSLPAGSRLGFGVMVRINDDNYILAFGPENPDRGFLNFNFFYFNDEFRQLHGLRVNDKIIIKSHNVSYAPKYSYPIISGDYIERNNKIIYKRPPHKGGC